MYDCTLTLNANHKTFKKICKQSLIKRFCMVAITIVY